jgi:hypothetical protein
VAPLIRVVLHKHIPNKLKFDWFANEKQIHKVLDFLVQIMTNTKTTKSTGFFNQEKNKGRFNSKSRLWNKKNENKNMTLVK